MDAEFRAHKYIAGTAPNHGQNTQHLPLRLVLYGQMSEQPKVQSPCEQMSLHQWVRGNVLQ